MSNPARAPSFPLTRAQALLSELPTSYLEWRNEDERDGFEQMKKTQGSLPNIVRMLEGLDMQMTRTFVIPRGDTVDKRVLGSTSDCLALAGAGGLAPRLRSVEAVKLTQFVYEQFPKDAKHEWMTKSGVGKTMRSKMFMSGGAEYALGRLQLAYPRVGVVPGRPILRAEAVRALRRCGMSLAGFPQAALKPFPLVPAEGQDGVSVNPVSDNGYPVLGKWEDPGASAKIMALASSLWAACVTARTQTDGVWNLVREMEEKAPELVAFRGKAKADYYSQDKIVSARLRFYNALPRQWALIIQTGTQPFEALSRSLLKEGHSGYGVSLVGGGAHDLVEGLQRMLDSGRQSPGAYGYVHVGDDSWVVWRDEEGIVMFSLDCSNFDLTQHREVTLELHKVLRDELRLISPVAAEVWYALARERLVVTAKSVVRRWRHAGPSGMPLQSKVNDMIMDVVLQRLQDILTPQVVRDRELLNQAIQLVGSGMLLSIRLEDYQSAACGTLVEALRSEPFLFIGRRFHVIGEEVVTCADLPRMMAQLPFPTSQWVKDKSVDLVCMEALRLGSLAVNLGLPPAGLEGAFVEFRVRAGALLERAERVLGTHVEAFKYAYAVSENPALVVDISSLVGLRRYLEKDPRTLWLRARDSLSPGLEVPLGTSRWIDMVEEEEMTEVEALVGKALVYPRGVAVGTAKRRPLPPAPTHAVTRFNDGRPPPTATWAIPLRPEATPLERLSALRGSRRARRLEHYRDATMLQWIEETHGLDWDSDDSVDLDWGNR